MSSEADELRRLLSGALDEVYRLRRALAYEARVVEAHYEGYKTFPKSRRAHAEEQVVRMRQAVTNPQIAYASTSSRVLDRVHESVTPRPHLTVNSWADELTARAQVSHSNGGAEPN